METNFNHQLRVGIFTTLGLVAIFTAILMLGGQRALFSQYAHLHARLDQAQGLNKGSVVSLTGVVVGNVQDITFSPEKKGLVVTMRIEDKYLPIITKGSLVEVRTQGALGDKFIYITPGDLSQESLHDDDYIETAKSSDLIGVLSEKGGEAEKVFKIIDEVYHLTRVINADGRSEKIVANLVQATADLKSTAEESRKMMAELRGQTPAKLKASAEHLDSILAKIDRGEGTLGALINDSSLHEQLKNLLGASSRKQSIQSLIRTSIEQGESGK